MLLRSRAVPAQLALRVLAHRLLSTSTSSGSLQWNLPPTVGRRLRTHGYAVVDDALPSQDLLTFRDELVNAAIDNTALLTANSTILVKKDGSSTLIPKHGIGEFDLSNAAVAHKLPQLARFSDSGDLIRVLQPLLFPDNERRLARQTVKAQINFGRGACFPLHFDTDASIDHRAVTAIMYLNEDYQSPDGGSIRVYPFPGAVVDIEPRLGRLVLFSSAWCLHRVLPSTANSRLCFTTWITTDEPSPYPKDPPSEPTDPDGDEAWEYLMYPTHRNHILKLVYADEWARSIVESHPAGHLHDLLLEQHFRDAEIIARAYGRYLPLLDRYLASGSLAPRVYGSEPRDEADVDPERKVAWF
ncbi:prolyl 4-hydroxylase [Polychytrium aggregatum]|uniref:prolyl 4-hydroxylase n=1 Tax=Polychytrium aggregatum TaxID=110093 RepID=UPI0022FE8A70|nr:prolyl 4-hydroxylase [Polychytrium aggregatum]KAI9205925.1 prolyl 4-hydroxylase [Polychytrium aggregatum]